MNFFFDVTEFIRPPGFPDSRFDIELQLLQTGVTAIAGVDEAGRGPLAGPVVSAAVILDPGNLNWDLNDSKKIPEQKRVLLADWIRSNAVEYSLGEASVEEIDRMNILQATVLSMKRALSGLKTHPGFTLVDGNYGIPGRVNTKAVVKGDARSLSISAASILAKVTRDEIMNRLDREFPLYGFSRNKGYGTEDHRKALVLYGQSPHHRKSFRLKSNP